MYKSLICVFLFLSLTWQIPCCVCFLFCTCKVSLSFAADGVDLVGIRPALQSLLATCTLAPTWPAKLSTQHWLYQEAVYLASLLTATLTRILCTVTIDLQLMSINTKGTSSSRNSATVPGTYLNGCRQVHLRYTHKNFGSSSDHSADHINGGLISYEIPNRLLTHPSNTSLILSSLNPLTQAFLPLCVCLNVQALPVPRRRHIRKTGM